MLAAGVVVVVHGVFVADQGVRVAVCHCVVAGESLDLAVLAALARDIGDEDLVREIEVSVDMFVVDGDGRVFLGERVDWPVQGLWCFGGRILPRETFRQTVSRNLKREIDVEVVDSTR